MNLIDQEIMMYPLATSMEYISRVIQFRLSKADKMERSDESFEMIPFPDWTSIDSPFAKFCVEHRLTNREMIVILLGLIPHVAPDFLDQVIQNSLPNAGDFPLLGGVRGKQFRGFLPTGETALFLAGGKNFCMRFETQKAFYPDHLFNQKNICQLEEVPDGEPAMSGKIIMSREYIDLFTHGEAVPPSFSMKFPAQRIETKQNWEDLILNNSTKNKIKELELWIQFSDKLLNEWGMGRKIKPGYRVLFYGPPGTGKTMTASLLGKYTGRPVYKIDLSMVVSKYIGETEKNLANLFATAENKNWILFFDEADALFGKRTNVQDAHDRYANQEVSYLLQRVEGYNGLAILASNFKSNIDDAFIRRFQSIIHFPLPKAQERLLIWQKAFPPQAQLAKDVDFNNLAQRYELSGAEIMNVVQYCCLRALEHPDNLVTTKDILNGIRREYFKEGKVMN